MLPPQAQASFDQWHVPELSPDELRIRIHEGRSSRNLFWRNGSFHVQRTRSKREGALQHWCTCNTCAALSSSCFVAFITHATICDLILPDTA